MAKVACEFVQPKNWDIPRLESLLKIIQRKKILVIGDVGVDRYTRGIVERISPEAPVPIVQVMSEDHKLGLAANVADNVSALGGIPYLLGVIGDDGHAELFKDLLKDAKIKPTDLVVDRDRRTVLKERIVSEGQQLLRVDYEILRPVSSAVEKAMLAKVQKLIPTVDVVIVEDYAKGLLSRSFCEKVFDLSFKNKKPVLVDPNLKTPVEFYRGAFMLTPNRKEAEALTGVKIEGLETLELAGQTLLKKTSAPYCMITLGKDGMAVFTKGVKSFQMIPTCAQEVFDVSGAGDTVIAVLALALASGAELEEAAVLANVAAGIEVGKEGTATVRPEEIGAALEYFQTGSEVQLPFYDFKK